MAEKYLGRRVACAHCPVACIHVAALREPYEKELFFYKTTMIPYDYELIYALGSMVGIFDVEDMLKLIDKVEIYGVDAMSIGVVLAWATEAQEKGLVSTDETMGLELKWGYLEGYLRAVENIVSQKNEFYRCLASGVDMASAKYGGEEYALAFGGNEMPGYHTGAAAHISHLVGSRHSHLDAGGYSVDQSILKGNEMTSEETVDKLLDEESWRQVLSSLVVCFFARGIFDPETVTNLLAVTGHEMSVEDLNTFGRMVHKMKYDFKVREGFKPDQLRIPCRIFETSSARGIVEEETIRSSIMSFFAKLESS